MKDISVLVHTKISNVTRLQNFIAAMGHTSREIRPLVREVMVLETDTDPKVRDLLSGTGIDHLFVEDHHPSMGRSWAKNVLAKLSVGEILWFCDDDFLFDPDAIESIAEYLKSTNISAVSPYDFGRCWRVPSALGGGITTWRLDKKRMPKLLPRRDMSFGAGGIAVRRDTFESFGGFDEGLLGWGLEDNILEQSLWRAGRPVLCAMDAWHLEHPKSDELDGAHHPLWRYNWARWVASKSDPTWDSFGKAQWPERGKIFHDIRPRRPDVDFDACCSEVARYCGDTGLQALRRLCGRGG